MQRLNRDEVVIHYLTATYLPLCVKGLEHSLTAHSSFEISIACLPIRCEVLAATHIGTISSPICC